MVKSTTCVISIAFFLVLMFVHDARGHGRLWEPPSRSSMWRRGYDSPVNYQDMELFCGGVGVQYGQNGGKCGVCGDPWNGPKQNEPGGKYANGIIVRNYKIGQVINITVQLTANHKGYFEFHICPSDDPFNKVTHDCLEEYPLAIVPGGETRLPIETGQYWVHLQARLPKNIRCRACMLQWKYNAGNSWGANPDGTGCIGCGNQEQFYGCADIAIGYDDVELGKGAEKGPWTFEETDSEWKIGVIKYNGTDNSAFTFRQKAATIMGSIFIVVLFWTNEL